MKKSKVKIGLIAVLGAIFLYGCTDDFLRDTKTDGVSEDAVYAGEATAVATVTGIYDSFQAEFNNVEYNTKSIFIMNHLTTDWGGPGANRAAWEFDMGASNEINSKMWNVHYIGIGKANAAIVNLPATIESGVLSPELGNRLIAEAKVLRSIFYYYMAASMGGVPLVLEPLSADSDFFAPRNTEEEVWQQLRIDLEEAVPHLPWNYDQEKGRVTKGTALAFLGSVYMWLGQYGDAVDAFQQMEGHYSLLPDFGRIHANDNQNNAESLFEIQFNETQDLSWGRNDNVTYLQSFCMPNEISNAGYGGIATQKLYDSFEAGDLRRMWTVIGPGEEHPDPAIDIINYPQSGGINTCGTEAEPWNGLTGDGQPRTGYYGVKTWRNPGTTRWGGDRLFSGQNHIWLRYGEVLISLAEAAVKSNQQAVAADALQRIRNRAWGGSAPALTGPITMTHVLNEYRHEIGGEFSLWTCLRRTKEPALLSQVFGMVTDGPRGMLLGIPQEQRDLNDNLTQNPGY